MPENQVNLIQKLSAINPNIIVVLQNGSAVATPWRNKVKAIVETFPEKIKDTPAYGTFNASVDEENYHEGIFVGYRHYDLKRKEVACPFGHGLSYTDFKYEDLEIVANTKKHVTAKIKITNVGSIYGKETAQIYIQNLESRVEKPRQELKAFVKVGLNPGESKTVEFFLDRRSFAWYNVKKSIWQVDRGDYNLKIGSSSRDIRLEKTVALEMGTTNNRPISGDTYISEIINQDGLHESLVATGLQTAIESISSSDSNRELMENLPLRAIIMIGANVEQVNKFIELANN